jgi:hypothetical protein
VPVFPRRVPDSLVEIADPLIEILGQLVPAADAHRARAALADMDLLSVRAIGLEVVLPPHPPACDVSVLMPPRHVPPFARVGHDVLAALAVSAGALDSTWWELDTSVEPSPVGAFIRSTKADALPLVQDAAAEMPDLARAVSTLEALVTPYWRGKGRLIGFFPDREPAPVAAALVPDLDGAAADVIRGLGSRATIAVDPDSDLFGHLAQHLDGSSIAIAADGDGRTAVSWEGSFWEREQAMADGRWAPALQPDPVWGDAAPSLSALLAVQGIHTFDALPTIRLLSGIDHIKIGPGGKVKAYVGAHIVMPGQR